jgi:hypothetical protein
MKFALEYAEGMFGLRRPKKQQEGKEHVMRIVLIIIFNADRVAVGYVAEVSEKLSA